MKVYEKNRIHNIRSTVKGSTPKTGKIYFDFNIKNKNIEERVFENKKHLQVLLDHSAVQSEEEYVCLNEKRINELLLNYNEKLKMLYENKCRDVKVNGQNVPAKTNNSDKLLKFAVNPDKFLDTSKKILLLNKLQQTNIKISKILNQNNT